MDIFVPNLKTIPPGQQSRLMGNRDPQSLSKLYLRQQPLHGLALGSRLNAGQLAARMARLDHPTPTTTRDMFPFRIFVPPSNYQANPGWSDGLIDSDGNQLPANWRTFQVWTGSAPSYLIQDASTNAPSNSQLGIPTQVYVARTGGYNLSGIMNSNTGSFVNVTNASPSQTVSNLAIIGENYNEYYSGQTNGVYLPNPTNGPNGTGPANFANSYNETCFTAPPSSIAVFWISWDTNTSVGGVPLYSFALNGENYATFPVLHFGGLTANAAYISANGTGYFGDLNATNGAAILGALPEVGLYDEGTPPQMYPFFPANAFAAPLNGGSQTPEGFLTVGCIVVGASGAAADTGNDGQVQIFQALFDNLHYPMVRTQFRGTYNTSNFYYPDEIVTENDTANCNGVTTYIQVTPLALQGVDPQNSINTPNSYIPTNYVSFKGLWIPLGGISQAVTINTGTNTGNAYFLMSKTINI